MLAVDWANLGYAGSFIAGLIVGGIAVARVTRMVMDWLRNDRDRH